MVMNEKPIKNDILCKKFDSFEGNISFCLRSFIFLVSVPEVDGQTSRNEGTVCACSGQDKLRKEINELKGQLNEVLMNQEVLLREIRAMRSSSLKNHPSVYQSPIAMPITSLEMLAEVDSMLALDSEFRVYMFHWFSGHLTTNLGQFVRNNLSKVISNKVAEGLSWSGRKGKRSMKDFHNLIYVLTGNDFGNFLNILELPGNFLFGS
ncbi:uncharacterized protein LOC124167090 [Ischnura elegans]|uniref:uncharacterized protein LOC124167090 n=1 Tax=Ischnura elegans TaxID=197161 RepID=UPI001ED8B037|nr:uncharacterized protein LOC124167090 [Ischnura elegans]